MFVPYYLAKPIAPSPTFLMMMMSMKRAGRAELHSNNTRAPSCRCTTLELCARNSWEKHTQPLVRKSPNGLIKAEGFQYNHDDHGAGVSIRSETESRGKFGLSSAPNPLCGDDQNHRTTGQAGFRSTRDDAGSLVRTHWDQRKKSA